MGNSHSRLSAAAYLTTIILAALAAWIAARQFIGWPLNATEIDFAMMPRILGARDAFEGTIYLTLAEHLSRLSVMPFLSGLLESWGIIAERQLVYFNLIQAFLMCLGPAAVVWAALRSRNPWLVPLGLLLFLLSGKHYLAYFKLVSSTFVSGIVILAVAFSAARSYRLAAAFAGLVGCIHPTYFLVTIGAIVFMHWFSSGPAFRPGKIGTRLAPLKPLLFVVIPIFAYWLINIGVIAQPQENKELWFSYMQSRSDLAFPLRQGIFQLGEALLFLALAGLVFRREATLDHDSAFKPLFFLTIYAILLVFIQIISSEIIHSSTLTRLALSHRIQFTFAIVGYVGLIAVVLRHFSSPKGALLWLPILAFVILNGVPRFPALALTDSSIFAMLVLALQSVENAFRPERRRVALGSLAAWLGAGAVIKHFASGRANIFISAVAALAAESYISRRWSFYSKHLPSLKRVTIMVVFAIASYHYAGKTNWALIVSDWHAFSQGEAADFDSEPRKGRLEYRQFIRFVTDHVGPNEQILAVPFFITQSFNPVPYRAMFMDWQESNYVLYIGGLTQRVIDKLAVYGIDPNVRPDWCTRSTMLFAKKGDKQHRCGRRALEGQAREKIMEWRDNIPRIRELGPKVSWVLIRQGALCEGDQVEGRLGDFALMKLDNAVPTSSCTRSFP